MINPLNLPAIGGALLAAVAVGIHLGESAIGLINPVHFQGPAIHPRDRGAAIDPDAVRPRPPAFDELYGWEEGFAARDAECGDCAVLAARDSYASADGYSAEVPYFGSYEERRAEARLAAMESRDPPPAIVRYASYPIEAEPEGEADSYPDYKAGDVYIVGGGDDAETDAVYFSEE